MQNQFTADVRAKQTLAQHPILIFFILAYAFSWVVWFIIPQNNGLSTIANYGPTIAAMILSVILVKQGDRGFRSRWWVVFAISFAAALMIWIQFDHQQHLGLGWQSGTATAVVAAFIVSGLLAGRASIRELLGPLSPRRVSWSSYLAALIVGPAIYLLAVGLDLALGAQLPPWPRGEPTPGLVSLSFGFIFIFGSAVTEEAGWRGFALPRLQRRFSPLIASVIIGAVWAFWHAPLYFVGQYTAASNTGPAGIMGILTRFIWVVPLAIVVTWLYNRSKRSLLVVMLLHASFNTTTALVPMSPRAGMLMVFGTMWIFALIAIVTGRMWRKTQEPAAREGEIPSTTSSRLIKPNPIFTVNGSERAKE